METPQFKLTHNLLEKLHYRRGNAVNPKYVFIGIAPGKDEVLDSAKRAFVGYSGQLLDIKFINAVGISLDDCYFTNVIKERIVDDDHERWIKENKQSY